MLCKLFKLLAFTMSFQSIYANKISFISYGDWGSLNQYQKMIANSISNYTYEYNSSFNIAMGDNFYENGVTSITDPLWTTNYKNIYNNNNPWYVILGNHDYYGNVTAQIEYTGLDSRWNMPNKNYVISDKYYKIIMLDTQQLDPICGEVPLEITSPANKKNIYNWLKKELASSEPLKIVVGHLGIYSASEHGNCNELIINLLPILESYNVALYLHGHGHFFEHNIFNGVDMIGCGSASKLSKYEDLKFSSDYTKYYTINYGFCFHNIENYIDNFYIRTKFVNEKGEILYEHISDSIPNTKNNTFLTFSVFIKYILFLFSIFSCLYCCYSLYLAQLQIEEQKFYRNVYIPEYNKNLVNNKNPLLRTDNEYL